MGVIDKGPVLIAEEKLVVLGVQTESGQSRICAFQLVGAEDHISLARLKGIRGQLVKGPVAAAVGQIVVAQLHRAFGDVFDLNPIGVFPILGQVPLVIYHGLADDQRALSAAAGKILLVTGSGIFKARGGKAGGDDIAVLAAVHALVRAGGGQIKALHHGTGLALQGQRGAVLGNGEAAVAVVPAVAAAEDHKVSVRLQRNAGDGPALASAAEIEAGEIRGFAAVVIKLHPVGEQPVIVGKGALVGGHHLVDAHGDEHRLRRRRGFRHRLRRCLNRGRRLLYLGRLLLLTGDQGTGRKAQQQGQDQKQGYGSGKKLVHRGVSVSLISPPFIITHFFC